MEVLLQRIDDKDIDINNVDKLISQIDCKIEDVNAALSVQMQLQDQIDVKLNNVYRAMTSLVSITNDARKLNTQIVDTAILAESVSAKVRRLDLARSHASECQQRVHDLIDLQLCSQGVLLAIKEEEYEKAANHIARFLAMDQQLLQRTADDVQSSHASVIDAVKILEAATVNMRELITNRFKEAVVKDDLASVERFFKIFPLLGCIEMGIDNFSNYICKKLSNKAQKAIRDSQTIAKAENRLPFAFADTLETILENIAKVVEVNQPVLEACYGKGHLKQMVDILQRECDSETKCLIDKFEKSRPLTEFMTRVQEYRTSMLTSVKNVGVKTHFRNHSNGAAVTMPKDIDDIIAQLALMHLRAELYFRFIQRRVTADIIATTPNQQDQNIKCNTFCSGLKRSYLGTVMQEIETKYSLLESYSMQENVLKAVAFDTYEEGQQCSSMVDEVFFIIRKSIRRAMSTASLHAVCAILNNVATVIETDFAGALRAPLKKGYPCGYIDLAHAYNAIQNSLQQGKLQPSDNENIRRKFLIFLNNADMSVEYLETLCQTMEDEINKKFPDITHVEREVVNSCMGEVRSTRACLKACVDNGLQQLESSAIKPRLHPWVDQFLNYNHHLTEEELAAYEAGETFVQFLIVHIDELLKSFKNSLSSRNYDALVSILATEVTLRLESAINKSTFNRLGGLILDQEVRALGSYLTSATSWSVRDKMTRLTQIATLLNLEKISELTDYWNPDDKHELPSWRLTPNEIKAILTLRTDFRMEDIKRISL